MTLISSQPLQTGSIGIFEIQGGRRLHGLGRTFTKFLTNATIGFEINILQGRVGSVEWSVRDMLQAKPFISRKMNLNEKFIFLANKVSGVLTCLPPSRVDPMK